MNMIILFFQILGFSTTAVLAAILTKIVFTSNGPVPPVAQILTLPLVLTLLAWQVFAYEWVPLG